MLLRYSLITVSCVHIVSYSEVVVVLYDDNRLTSINDLSMPYHSSVMEK